MSAHLRAFPRLCWRGGAPLADSASSTIIANGYAADAALYGTAVNSKKAIITKHEIALTKAGKEYHRYEVETTARGHKYTICEFDHEVPSHAVGDEVVLEKRGRFYGFSA